MDWEDYEKFVERICAELGAVQGVKVFSKRKYAAISGRNIEIDLSFELEALGSRIFGIVECKYYRQRVSAQHVLAFAKTIELVRAHKGIFVTTLGYQSGAIIEAEREGIALAQLSRGTGEPQYIVRKPKDNFAVIQGRLHLGLHYRGDDGPGPRFDSARQLVRILQQIGTRSKMTKL